ADPARISDAVVDAMRLPVAPNSAPLDRIADALSRRPSLLLLDNFEQLVDGGAEWVAMLRERVAGLQIVVTSRRALGLEGEEQFPVPPLPVPKSGADIESLSKCD